MSIMFVAPNLYRRMTGVTYFSACAIRKHPTNLLDMSPIGVAIENVMNRQIFGTANAIKMDKICQGSSEVFLCMSAAIFVLEMD